MVLKNTHVYNQAPKSIVYSSGGSDEVVIPGGKFNALRLIFSYTASGTTAKFGLVDFASLIQVKSSKHGILVSANSRELFFFGLRYHHDVPSGVVLNSSGEMIHFTNGQTLSSASGLVPISIPCSVNNDEQITVSVKFNTTSAMLGGSGSLSGNVYIMPEYVDNLKTAPIYIRGRSASDTGVVTPDEIPGTKLLGETVITCGSTEGSRTNALTEYILKHDQVNIVEVTTPEFIQLISECDMQYALDGVYHVTHVPFDNNLSTTLTTSGNVASIDYVFVYEGSGKSEVSSAVNIAKPKPLPLISRFK